MSENVGFKIRIFVLRGDLGNERVRSEVHVQSIRELGFAYGVVRENIRATLMKQI